MADGNGPTDREWGELRSDVKHIKETLDDVAKDHEKRLRKLENQSLLKWIAQAVTVIAAAFGIRTGWGNP